MCHGHRKRRRFSDIIASMVTAVLGDDVPDVSWLIYQCLIITTGPNFDCKLISIACVVVAGHRDLITHLFDSQWSRSCQGHCRVVGQDTFFLLFISRSGTKIIIKTWRSSVVNMHTLLSLHYWWCCLFQNEEEDYSFDEETVHVDSPEFMNGEVWFDH